ncbi:PREDICTED: uncharacterized protein LOC108361088 isoform X1 [Rhagoletis zephyria]|uniref:uncharacterized protein LOC108361088 isoform X1 n=1 Tax=Rhagoletis zephyria TaxID=28612 RepID=UPI00081198B1|nr:PREDICTED: uncharacterized protein LOC108361088 isoform X1 [Rhagoletis zephyria]XP_017469106.1 PREDICTED: uncharacterized protein LOC108361088 isoform X1 [Rhagoletis zephyria]XP_017469107.1 PREDICTED: uncharacterized protein LOC108361088 isoform X1 [Rhagoletis zephyria]
MEQNALATEDSVDSIPGPAYERIVGATPILTYGAKVDNRHANSVILAVEEGAEMEDEEGTDIDGDDDDDMDMDTEEPDDEQRIGQAEEESIMEHDYRGRDDYKENESNLVQKELDALEGAAVAAAAATEQINDNISSSTITSAVTTIVEPVSKPVLETIVTDKVTTMRIESSSADAGDCPIPVQIVSALTVPPKLLSMQSKNNKVIMVQMLNEQAVDGKNASVKSTLTDPLANDPIATETEVSDSAGKTHSPNQDKSPNLSQQQQNQQHSSRFLARSSTPLSREFLALQRSVNESKVLSEFVTDAVRKRQKSAPKDANEPATSQHHHHHHHYHAHGEKPRKPGKFAPLKDDNASSTSSTIPRRSRSKSVNRKSIDGLDAAGGKLKRWPSDEKLLKRTNMRSQNSEFVQKQIEFLNRVKHDEGEVSSEAEDGERSLVNGGDEEEMHLPMEHNTMNDSNVSAPGLVGSTSSLLDASLEVGGKNCMPVNVDSIEARLMAYWAPPPKRGWDSFCWKCRECVDLFPCSKCVRGFHCTCIKVTASTKLDDSWVCPECVSVENVLNGPKRSSRRGEVSLDLLSQLLSFALKRMKMVKGYPKFLYSDEDLLHYSKYIVNPVTFTTLQEKVEKRAFRCSEEFLNETKWILHNALILNSGSEYPSETDFTKSHTLQLPTSLSASSKEVFTAKSILKVCRQEANEIDTCGECYLNANTRPDWFVDVCSQPHLLLWAKLKGFPYWPAKAMGPGQGLSHVNVRFFGEHDRAFVPVKDCFLYSEQDPNTQTGKRSARELADCIKEVELHIEKIKVKVGAFKYAKIKTPYEPAEELQQLEMMMPGVTEYMKRQQSLVPKPSLQYKIVKTADNHLSIIKKASATESGNDSDHSGSPNKKSSCSVSSGSGNGLGASVGDIKTSQIAPKYEVVSKASSDDSNSSKVTAVILKRKPSSEHKKEASEDLDLPMPKMIKFDEEEDEHKLLASGSTAKPTSGCAVNTGDNAVGKRKHGTDNSGGSANTSGGSAVEPERHRTKHAKNEPRVPLLTIKTNANGNTLTVASDGDAKPVATNPNTSATSTLNAEVKTATVCVKEEVAAVAKAIALTPPTNNAQTVMENLVKKKHGVTIKKISKEVAKKASTESTKLTVSANATPDETQAVTQLVGKDALSATAVVSETQLQSTAASHTSDSKSGSGSKTENGSGSDKPKTEENKKGAAKSAADTHILKDLVPFVEIKREFTSDDEADSQTPANVGRQDKKQTSAKVPANEKTGAATSTAVPSAQISCATAAQVPLPAVTTPNLSLVKQEVMSDDEETSTKINVASNVVCTASTQPALGSVAAAGEKAIDMQPTSSAPNPLPDAVRVGDTMIQRVNAKNVRNPQATLVPLKSPAQVAQEAAAAMDAATAVAAAMHASPPNRRLNARGVPYGPLPASVVAQPPQQSQKSVVVASNATNRASLQQQQQPPQQQQLPQSQSPAQLQVQVQVQAQTQPQPQPQPMQLPPQQRARKSFPNRGTTDISPARSNFPAAPLPSPGLPPPSTSPLATSNDLKRTLLKNSMVSIPRQAWSPHEVQRNAAVGTSSSNTSNHSIPVPPLTAVSKTPAVGAVLGDNNNAANANNNNSSNSNANATINSTPIATPFISCNGGGMGSSGPAMLTPLTMSAPPPLAGLSSSLSSPSTNLLAPTAIASVTGNLPIVVNSSSNVGGSISISSAVELPTQQTVSAAVSASGVPSTSNGDFVTPSLAAMVTDAICRGPPKMVQRPNGPLQSDGANMFPSQAGPVCQTLVENAHKLTDFFISVMEDTMLEMSVGEEPVLQAKITLLKMELERTKQAYEQEIAELKRTSDLMLCEMRKSMENEKTRIANEIRKQCEQERLRSIEETKKKQWCSNCGREAQFYCCWNTSYCDYPCQQMHWSRHSATCAQTRPTNANVCDSLAKTASSTMTTTVSAVGQQQQQQQQQQLLGVGGGGSKASSSNIMTVTTTTSMAHQQASHYNKAMSNKKDKHGASKMSHQQSVANAVSSAGNVGSNSMATIAAANASGISVPAGAATELLKLPSNTYLRTVPQCGNAGTNNSSGGNLRGSTYSVQRVNIPLPITALVQRGNSWELTSAAPTNNAGATNMATITAPPSNVTPATMTQLTPQQQQQQQQQQQRMMSSVASSGGVSSTMTMSRGNSRSRAAAAAQAMQQTMATMHNASSGGGGSGAASSLSCGVLRPTQM